jgi:hypothetical protein
MFAEDYYETELPINSIKHIYQHRPLTTEIVESLNPDATLKMVAKDLKEIGYVTKPAK